MSDAVGAVLDEMISAYTSDRRTSRTFAAERLVAARSAEGDHVTLGGRRVREAEREVAEAEETALGIVREAVRRARASS